MSIVYIVTIWKSYKYIYVNNHTKLVTSFFFVCKWNIAFPFIWNLLPLPSIALNIMALWWARPWDYCLIQFLKAKKINPLILGPCKVQFCDHPLWSKERWFFFSERLQKGNSILGSITPSLSNEGHKSSPNRIILLPPNGNITTILKP
jgi:hypothetical protein